MENSGNEVLVLTIKRYLAVSFALPSCALCNFTKEEPRSVRWCKDIKLSWGIAFISDGMFAKHPIHIIFLYVFCHINPR